MEQEFKVSVGLTKVNYDWQINSVPILSLDFEIVNLDPRIDPTEAGSYLCRALEKYLEEKNDLSKPLPI